jgi:hypothetical protein
MNTQLALALLALGPVKSGLAAPAPSAEPQPASSLATTPAKDARDPIAFLAREWLAKR